MCTLGYSFIFRHVSENTQLHMLLERSHSFQIKTRRQYKSTCMTATVELMVLTIENRELNYCVYANITF